MPGRKKLNFDMKKIYRHNKFNVAREFDYGLGFIPRPRQLNNLNSALPRPVFTFNLCLRKFCGQNKFLTHVNSKMSKEQKNIKICCCKLRVKNGFKKLFEMNYYNKLLTPVSQNYHSFYMKPAIFI